MKMFSDTYLHWPIFDLLHCLRPISHGKFNVQVRRDGRRSAKAVVVVIVVGVVLLLLLLIVVVFLSLSHPLLVDRSMYK